jgi:hypothetical protein
MIKEIQGHRWRNAGIKAGITTEQDLDEMAKAWDEWSDSDEASLAMMQGEILVQKSP